MTESRKANLDVVHRSGVGEGDRMRYASSGQRTRVIFQIYDVGLYWKVGGTTYSKV